MKNLKTQEWDGLSLSPRIRNILRNWGCSTREDAQKVPLSGWLERPGIGPMTAVGIIAAVNGIDDSKPVVRDVWREFKRAIFLTKSKPSDLSDEELLAIMTKLNLPSPR